jgi:acetylornithine deacetylase/succinyl-diaminopimelate desuccinylase-like protein
MSDALAAVEARLDRDTDAALNRLKELLAIPSVSTVAAHNADTQRAAVWLANDLTSIGFDADVRETQGHPIVVGHHLQAGSEAPHVLYYGHYDVQPADPLELWEHPPFEPTITEGEHGPRIVCRGAADDKGQLMTFIEAMRAWKREHGTLPINVTVLLEGEEESGSPSLDAFLEANREELSADVCVVTDTGMWDINTPAITYMLRGLVYVEVTLHGPGHDLHSGMYGGTVINPINALCSIIGRLIDDDGIIQIPGFYDDVIQQTEAQRVAWGQLGFDEAGFLQGAGLTTSVGEVGYTTAERIWSRPTCDVNGIIGGYTGDGAKTVIASHARAKLSFRLVANQDPQKVYDGLVRFLEHHKPPDCSYTLEVHGLSPAIRVPTESPYLEAAMAGLGRAFDREAVLIGCGGSIPVVGSFQQILGFDSLLLGFSLDDDRVHSPNEKFEVCCFTRGARAHAAVLDELSKCGKPMTA